MTSQDKKPNHLINESSPYLLQHAYNPVDWYPWGEKALKKAQEEDKLLIISIGYAACHWCHVMEHESFEDSTVAMLMNENFISIKVDREERPDIDDIYMTAAQLITGGGGWPLNAFAMPDGRPIWAGTYFPKERWMDILKQFADLKATDPVRLERTAKSLASGINSVDNIVKADLSEFNAGDLDGLSSILKKQTDLNNGGQRGAPKFPMPNNYEFLLRYACKASDDEAFEALYTTLDKMALGGIYDQVGGGFARYSVDSLWKVPHFEKMLYDNAQLISLYSNAYRQSSNPLSKKIVEESIAFVQRELTAPDGGFYSSLDADSEGEEGKFYVWTAEELAELLPDPVFRKIVEKSYSIRPEGNWEHGNNILHFTTEPAALAKEFKLSAEEYWNKLAEANAILLKARSHRVRPGLDDKILTSWNALMIKAYVDAYKALGEESYLQIATEQAHLLLSRQWADDGRLNRNYKGGKSSINAFLDDYALLMEALISLYEVSFDESWINVSRDMSEYVHEHFFDPESHMYFYTSDIDPPLVARKKETSDNVISSSNSVMARNLLRLGELFYNQDYIERARQMLGNMWPAIMNSAQPRYYSNWLQLFFEEVYPAYEVAVVGPDALAISHQMMQQFHSNAMFLGSTVESNLPLLQNKYVEGRTMIYVCQNKVCKLPVTDIQAAQALIK